MRTDQEEAARDFIRQVSEEYSDATHHAFAYKIGGGDQAIVRENDAGEPAGTAGPPLLQAIEKAGLTQVTVVATRYFGGVKLGDWRPHSGLPGLCRGGPARSAAKNGNIAPAGATDGGL
jgi:putative IMPACT (imprinted ancient) family translation regulator